MATDDGASTSGSSSGNGEAFVPSSRARASQEAAAAPTLKEQAAASNREVYDKLIEVFRSKKPADWRKLIAYSKQWPSLAPGVLARVEERAAAAAAAAAATTGHEGRLDEQKQEQGQQDGGHEAVQLRRLRRQLGSVHEELTAYQVGGGAAMPSLLCPCCSCCS